MLRITQANNRAIAKFFVIEASVRSSSAEWSGIIIAQSFPG
jgi:hypothetical protein